MSFLGRITPAERRLAVLLFILSLLGYAVGGLRRLSPDVETWLTGEARPDARLPAGDSTGAPDAHDPSRADSGAGHSPPAAESGFGSGGALATPEPAEGPVLVDPNRADRDLLVTLPGVGPVLAGRIVEDRARRGPFRGPEDLLRVAGIGPSTLARLRPFLRFDPLPAGSNQPGG